MREALPCPVAAAAAAVAARMRTGDVPGCGFELVPIRSAFIQFLAVTWNGSATSSRNATCLVACRALDHGLPSTVSANRNTHTYPCVEHLHRLLVIRKCERCLHATMKVHLHPAQRLLRFLATTIVQGMVWQMD